MTRPTKYDWPTLLPMIERELARGTPLAFIARQIGCDASTLRNVMGARYEEIRAEQQRRNAARDEMMARLWNAGLPAAQIARRAGLSEKAVSGWVCHNRERFGLKWRVKDITPDDVKGMRLSLEAGSTVTAVAKEYGVSTKRVVKATGMTSNHGKAYRERVAPAAPSVSIAKLNATRAVSDLRLPRRDRIREAIAHWRDRGLSDPAIARELRLSASVATGYGLAVREDVADPFGMDPRRRQGRAA